MFFYEKKLQFPVKIATPNPKLAAFIISQYGGPDGELGASMRYLSQRYTMPYAEAKGVLTDIGVEELAPSRYLYLTTSLFSASPNKNASPVVHVKLRRRRFHVSFSLLFPGGHHKGNLFPGSKPSGPGAVGDAGGFGLFQLLCRPVAGGQLIPFCLGGGQLLPDDGAHLLFRQIPFAPLHRRRNSGPKIIHADPVPAPPVHHVGVV